MVVNCSILSVAEPAVTWRCHDKSANGAVKRHSHFYFGAGQKLNAMQFFSSKGIFRVGMGRHMECVNRGQRPPAQPEDFQRIKNNCPFSPLAGDNQ
jgi:hypothetical protein